MTEIIKEIEELVDREIESNTLKKELGTLGKLLKIGFEEKTKDIDKVSKIFSTADEARIKQFYDSIANQIKGMAVSKDFEKFAEYLKITHSIKIEIPETYPTIRYTTKDKDKKKFNDIFSHYFIDDVPKDPCEALDKILKSIYNVTKEWKKESEPIKDDFKQLLEHSQESPVTIKMISQVLKTAKLKEESLDDVSAIADQKLAEQQKGLDLIEKRNDIKGETEND